MSQSIRGKARLLGFIMALAMLVSFAPGIHAQSVGSAGTSVSPPITDITANPGESIVKHLEVVNNGTASQAYLFSVANLAAAGENGEAAYSGPESGDVASWISLSPESVNLGAGEKIDLKVTINIPSNAPAGGHYATVFARTGGSSVGDGSGSAIGQMVGANLLLKVTGNVIEKAQVASFAISDSSFDVGESTAFEVRVANMGNSHIAPSGFVELFRDGTRVAQLPVNKDGANILPNSARRFVVASDPLYLPGSYSAKLSLTYGGGSILTTSEDIAFIVRGEYSMLVMVSILLAVLVGALAVALLVKRKKVKV